MTPPTRAPGRVSRTVRGLLASGLAVHVAAFLHVAGGGVAPAPVAVALTLAFAAPLAVALAGRALGAVRVTATVVFSQVLFHLLFTLSPAPSPAIGSGGHVHGDALVLPALDAVGPPMWQAHALAAAVTTAALLAGARAVAALEAAGRTVLLRLLGCLRRAEPIVLVRPRAPRPVRPFPGGRLAAMLALRHRGPPALGA